jgi:hypothetical protein
MTEQLRKPNIAEKIERPKAGEWTPPPVPP